MKLFEDQVKKFFYLEDKNYRAKLKEEKAMDLKHEEFRFINGFGA